MENLRQIVVDLVQLAPTSFSAMYGFVARALRKPPGVASVLDLMRQLVEDGLVEEKVVSDDGSVHAPEEHERLKLVSAYRGWLDPLGIDDLGVDSLSYDRIGLWFVPSAALKASAKPSWTVDVDEQKGILRVSAKTRVDAEQALDAWVAHHAPTMVVAAPLVPVRQADSGVITLEAKFHRTAASPTIPKPQ